jgi:Protein of unknown function (DUF2380)
MKNILLILMLLVASPSYANNRIAILESELDDGTMLPNVASEITRTASFKPLLEKALKSHYQIVAVDKAVYQQANAGKGYLFEHHDLSAELGKKLGADWVLVLQHRKLSFMYSTLLVHLINVKTQQLAGNYFAELKGNNQTVTERSIKALAAKIYRAINL